MELPSPLTVPPELLEKYTPQQLADALAALVVADVQAFAAEVKQIDATVQRMEDAEGGFSPFPRLGAEFDAEVKAVFNSGAAVVAEGRQFIVTMRDLRAKAAVVRTRYEQYAGEVRSVLGTVERSPRG